MEASEKGPQDGRQKANIYPYLAHCIKMNKSPAKTNENVVMKITYGHRP